MTKGMSKTAQEISSALGMFEAMRHQRDKAQAGLDASQAEIRRQRDRADQAEARIERCSSALDAEHIRANLAEAQLRGGTNDTYIIELSEATA